MHTQETSSAALNTIRNQLTLYVVPCICTLWYSFSASGTRINSMKKQEKKILKLRRSVNCFLYLETSPHRPLQPLYLYSRIQLRMNFLTSFFYFSTVFACFGVLSLSGHVTHGTTDNSYFFFTTLWSYLCLCETQRCCEFSPLR